MAVVAKPVLAGAAGLCKKALRRGLATVANTDTGIKKVGVVGLGLMGHGIAQVAAMAPPNYHVVGIEADSKAVEGGRKRIETSLSKMLSKQVEKGKLKQEDAESQKHDILHRITYATDKGALHDCDLVIEAIIEDPKIKLPFYEELGRLTKKSCILASNTSSLKIMDMAVASKRPDRVVGLHFFNPVQLMRLVEVIKTTDTDPEVFARCKEWVQSVGKQPVSCGDTPGFIVNRLLVPYLGQAMLMVDRGDASVEDIDTSMKLGAGHPMGPLELADYVGLDTCQHILGGWVKSFPDEPSFVVPEVLKAKVGQKKYGRKSGEGFYKWEGDRKVGVSSA